MKQAVRAYASAAEHRSVREQEAEIFRFANAALRRARESDKRIVRVRALADNDRLWLTVMGLVSDPENALPDTLRASIISVGLAVQREMQRDSPNFDFLIAVNENIAAGLSDTQ
jgi:flagellar protein FlaF